MNNTIFGPKDTDRGVSRVAAPMTTAKRKKIKISRSTPPARRASVYTSRCREGTQKKNLFMILIDVKIT
jgi:hypothetical protein